VTNTTPITHTKAQRLAQSALGDSMFTLQDIAGRCSVTYRCVQGWRKQGLLPPPDFALGKVIRWRRSTIDKFIDHQAAIQGSMS